MGSAVAAVFLLPAATTYKTQQHQQLLQRDQNLRWSPLLHGRAGHRTRRSIVPVARLFGPAIFEASKLKVLFLGVDQEKHPGHLPRTYTLTHSDITAKLTLAISQTINSNQLGWYNKLQRDEVVAEWKKVKGKMSLHVHCHISGGHFLLDFIANLRYFIFSKELPVVLKAFVHGDMDLFCTYPELEESLVWVYFHSNLPEFNRVQCWGPLREAASGNPHPHTVAGANPSSACPMVRPQQCSKDCSCCFPPYSTIPWAHEFDAKHERGLHNQQQRQL